MGKGDGVTWKQLYIFAFFAVQIPLPLSLADEILPIGKIVTDAPAFAQHLVTFRGTVKSVEQIPPVPIRGCLSPDRYKANIEDETGSIEVLFCGSPGAKGDHVLIRAVISVMNSEGFLPTILATAKYVEQRKEDVK
jgi:hypothetical protein